MYTLITQEHSHLQDSKICTKKNMYMYVYDRTDPRLNPPVEYLSAVAEVKASEKLEHEESDIVGV